MQLDSLMNDLVKAREVEKAAAMDVCDRADERRRAELRLKEAEQAHEAEKANVERIRRRIDFQINAQTDSPLDAPLPKGAAPCDNIAQFYGMLEGPET